MIQSKSWFYIFDSDLAWVGNFDKERPTADWAVVAVDVTRSVVPLFLWHWLTVFESKKVSWGCNFCGCRLSYFCDTRPRCTKRTSKRMFHFLKDGRLHFGSYLSSSSEWGSLFVFGFCFIHQRLKEREERGWGGGSVNSPANLACTCYTFWGRRRKGNVFFLTRMRLI